MKFPFQRTQLKSWLENFGSVRIAVVGDFFLDRYLAIDPRLAEVSVETGLTAHQVVEIRNSPGAAGTVVNNLVALGAGSVFAIGVIGDDGYGFELRRALERQGVDTKGLLVADERFTPVYSKPVSLIETGECEMERMDIVNRRPLPSHCRDALDDRLEAAVNAVDAVVILDQVEFADCGVVTGQLRETAAKLARRHPEKLFHADSRAFIGRFRNVTVKPNLKEALAATGREADEIPGDFEKIAATLQKETGKTVYLTLGEQGILVHDGRRCLLASGCPVSGPVDVTGAGDSATAGIVLSSCSGADAFQAASVGNLVASITVQQLGGTGTAYPSDVLARFDALSSD